MRFRGLPPLPYYGRKKNMENKFEKNLAEGSVAKNLILFAIPFIFSNLIQSLYNVADMIIVGQFSGTISMSGVNIGGQITNIVTNLVIGLAAGATVLIGQYLGAGQKRALEETIGTLFSTLLVAAVVLSVVMIAFRVPILRLIQTPEESFDEANRYLSITMAGTIFIFGYNALSAVMRGMGDSRRPLYFVTIACFVNIFLDILMVKGWGMGAAGAALATVISQAVSMILCILYLRRNNFVFSFSLKSFRFHKLRLRMLLRIGIPTSVQSFASSLSFLFLTTMVNGLGVTASAAVGAVGKFNGFAILPAVAISNSVAAMSAQNIGAGKIKRAQKTFTVGLILSFSISAVIFILSRLFPGEILAVFADDADMVAAGIVYMASFGLDYLCVPFYFNLNGLFNGSGHTTFSLINGSMASVLVRIPTCYFFGSILNMGLGGYGLGAPCASLAAAIVGFIYFFSGRWKVSTIIREGESA